MSGKKRDFLLRDLRQMKRWAGICGAGFLLYLVVSALLPAAAVAVAAIFAPFSVWNFFSVMDGRQKDKEAVSYNLLWGTGALALMLAGCAVLELKLLLGL